MGDDFTARGARLTTIAPEYLPALEKAVAAFPHAVRIGPADPKSGWPTLYDLGTMADLSPFWRVYERHLDELRAQGIKSQFDTWYDDVNGGQA